MGNNWHRESLRTANDPLFSGVMKRVADNIQRRREAMCLSQTELGERANTNYHFVCKIETKPESSNPYFRTIWFLAKALECRVADLMVEEPLKFPTEGFVPGTPQHRLAELAKRLPPAHAKALVQEAEKRLKDYYALLQKRPPL